MKDQGLEKAAANLRKEAWEQAVSSPDNPWKAFKDKIQQTQFGGVFSEAEAWRLFVAEQIGQKNFLAGIKSPQDLARKLSEEIQNTFQHSSKPISTRPDSEQQVIEIIHYYFPGINQMQNFQAALDGKLEDLIPATINPEKTAQKKQRPLVETYLEFKKNGQTYKFDKLSTHLKEIIDDYFDL